MRKTFAAGAGIFFNAAVGFYLLMVPAEQIDTVLYWMLVIVIPLFAVLSILAFGILSLGWAGMMSEAETDNYAPGSKGAIDLYNATVNALNGYTRGRFYVSFACSVLLMAGIAAQGWVFILVLEVLGSAIGYGFVHWVMNNTVAMHKRAYGE